MSKPLLVLLTLLLTISPVPILGAAQADTPDWLSGWSYRKTHNITGNAVDAGTNYQFIVNVEFGEGADSGNTVYLGLQSQADFDDIRFTDDDGTTLLDYWRESYTASDSALFWVEVQDSIGISETIQFYIYYGRDSVNTTSNGDATFNLFSDFRQHMDLDSWTRYSASDDFVKSEDIELVGIVDTVGKCEGFVYDGEYYYLSTFDSPLDEGWLYQVNGDIEIVRSLEVTDGTLSHTGGICLYDGYLYVPMAEGAATQVYPSKLKRYHAETLSYVDTVATSAGFDNDHWGGVVIVGELNRMYVSNWGVEELYVFEIDGTYVTTIETPPDFNIQDFVYVEEEGLIYGSKQDGAHNIISVWRPDGNGDSLTFMGEVMTENVRTTNGFTWYDGYFYSCLATPTTIDPCYIRKMSGSDLELEIYDYYIYNETAIGPNLMMEARLNMGGNRKFNMGFSATHPTGGTQIGLHNSDGVVNIFEGNEDDDCGFTFDSGTWITLSLAWYDNNAKAYKNRGSVHSTFDADIAGTSLEPDIALWGSADVAIYCKWVLIRNWVYSEPIRDGWGAEELIGLSTQILWNVDVAVLFFGLIMIPSSFIYLIRGGKDDMSTDKFFYFMLFFFVGMALFLGVILP